MSTLRDEILDSAIWAEQRLRDVGGKGNTLGEMLRDLGNRKAIPGAVQRAGTDAERVRNRVADPSVALAAIEVEQWRSGMGKLNEWLDGKEQSAMAARMAGRGAGLAAAPTPSRRRGAKIPAPWVVVALVSVVIGGVASAIHYTPGAGEATQTAVHRVTEGFGPHEVSLPLSQTASAAPNTAGDAARPARHHTGHSHHETRAATTTD